MDNNWHHFVFVFDKTISLSVADIKIYFDGTLLTNKLENYVPFPSAGIINTQPEQPVTFGGFPIQNDPNSFSLNGSLDDIAIWNRALTPEEVQELYTLDACTFTVYDTVIVENVIDVFDMFSCV